MSLRRSVGSRQLTGQILTEILSLDGYAVLPLTDTLLTKFKVPLHFLIKRLSYFAGFQYTRKFEIEIINVKTNSSLKITKKLRNVVENVSVWVQS